MALLQLEFTGNGRLCTAEVVLEGIAGSWDADVKVTGHPVIDKLHIKYWLGAFLMPVFNSREDAVFFEPLFDAIEEQAKKVLPTEFD